MIRRGLSGEEFEDREISNDQTPDGGLLPRAKCWVSWKYLNASLSGSSGSAADEVLARQLRACRAKPTSVGINT